MRHAVLDIGSRAVHLKIADLVPGGPPEPVTTLKQSVRLAEATDHPGVISQDAIRRLTRAVPWGPSRPPRCATRPTVRPSSPRSSTPPESGYASSAARRKHV